MGKPILLKNAKLKNMPISAGQQGLVTLKLVAEDLLVVFTSN